MKKNFIFSTLLIVSIIFLNISNLAYANIINVPADQPTIQAEIDAAMNGDTVLVQPETYVENINYNGKNIVVGSLFLTTRDTSYISQTVIDGDSLDSVVKFENNEDSTAVLCGFTITNGNAYRGGGTYCKDSSPSLNNITITSNSAFAGGGICCYTYSSPSFKNIKVINNSADRKGGGIYCYYSFPRLENVSITSNSALTGGGIYCETSSSPSLTNLKITNNYADFDGGGIYCCNNSSINFDNENRCNIYLNNITNSKGYGADIFATGCDTINVIVDTFTVLTPTDYYASPIDKFTFDILHSIQDSLINADLYVSVDGNNFNNGTTPDEPLKTIKYALSRIYADSLNPHTIYLSPGIYSTITNGEIFPIGMSNYVSLEGNEEDDTILDADSINGVLRFNYVIISNIMNITIRNGNATGNYPSDRGGGIYCYNSSPRLENITITSNSAKYGGGGIFCRKYSNPILLNVTIIDNYAEVYGGGIFCWDSNPSLENVIVAGNSANDHGGGIFFLDSNPSLEDVIITGNSASTGGGVYCYISNPCMTNVMITDNYAYIDGGGIYCRYYSNPSLVNVTISNNSSSSGGGILCERNSSPSLVNCILWNDSPQEIYFSPDHDPNSITISYSDIQGGETGIVTNNNGTVYWLEGNIDADPLFIDPENGDYHLSWANFPIPDSTKSPCIDAGDPDPQYNDPDGTRNDMGAYYFDQTVGVDDENNPLIETELFNNYPNPFNKITTIRYFVPKYTEVKIQIYNLKGQLVKTLVNDDKPAGYHTVEWNVLEKSGMCSGIYFYKLSTKDKTFVKKMILIR